MTIEQIIALLATKFPGVRKDVLTAMAGVISIQAASDEEVNEIVGKMTADKVTKFGQDFRSPIDREIQQSVQTAERNLREKYNFVEKKKDPESPKPVEPGALTLDNIKQIFAQQMEPLQQELAALKAGKLADARREQFAGLFKDKNIQEDMVTLLKEQFDHMTFKDDEAFNSFIASSQTTIDRLAQQQKDQQLSTGAPRIRSTIGADGIGSDVAGYLKRKSEASNDLGGKAI